MVESMRLYIFSLFIQQTTKTCHFPTHLKILPSHFVQFYTIEPMNKCLCADLKISFNENQCKNVFDFKSMINIVLISDHKPVFNQYEMRSMDFSCFSLKYLVFLVHSTQNDLQTNQCLE